MAGDIVWQNGVPLMDTGTGLIHIAPIAAAQYSDPQVRAWAASMGAQVTPSGASTGQPSGGLTHESGTWNPSTGQWDQPLDYGNLLSLGIAGAIAAPLVAGAVAGGGAGAAGAGSAGAGTSAGIDLGYTVPGAAAATGGSGAVGATAAGGSSALSSPALWGQVIGAGTGVIGSAIQANTAGKSIDAQLQAAEIAAQAQQHAADVQAASAANALAFQNKAYAAKQAQVAPYIAAGQSAINRLTNGLGLAPATGGGMPTTLSTLSGSAPVSSTPGAPAGTAVTSPTSGMTPAQLQSYLQSAYAAHGQALDPGGLQTWTNYYNQWGSNDPQYFASRLNQGLSGGGGSSSSSAPQTTLASLAQPTGVPQSATPATASTSAAPSGVSGLPTSTQAQDLSGSSVGQMVTLRSPDGKETKSVPAQYAQYWIQQGAQPVGA